MLDTFKRATKLKRFRIHFCQIVGSYKNHLATNFKRNPERGLVKMDPGKARVRVPQKAYGQLLVYFTRIYLLLYKKFHHKTGKLKKVKNSNSCSCFELFVLRAELIYNEKFCEKNDVSII